MLKSRSVDVTADPADIYDKVSAGLKKEGLQVEEVVELDPFQVDHAAILVRK